MQITTEKAKMKQFEIADQLSYSTGTLQRYRYDINVLSAYGNQPNIINERSKRFHIQSLITISIVNMTSKDLN